MAEKKNDQAFTVTDRRKFTTEGELRQDVVSEEQTTVSSKPQTAESKPKATAAEPSPPPASQFGPVPPAPSAREQQAQQEAYRESGKRLEPSPLSGRTPQDYEMNFERLVASLYMSAMMQLGLLHEQGQQPVADLLGAKQSIDTLGVLQEKTKGNLTEVEQNLLQNCLYELRVAFVDLTNAVARASQVNPGGPGDAK
jgi:hypothetical protein